MKKLSKRHNRIEPSSTITTAKLSRQLIAEGKDVINMSMGMPDFNTPDHIKDAAKEAIDNNFTFYPPVAGYPDLKEAIVNKLKRENGLTYKIDNIVVSPGAKLSVANLMLSLLDKEDEIIIPAPYWVSYTGILSLVGAKECIIPCNIKNDFKLSPEQLKKNISSNTKALIFSSPCNPTGSVYSKAELKSLVEVLKEHPDVVIISDEIYEHITFNEPHISIASFEEIRDRVVIINGVSKGFAMTGWRIGYIAAPEYIAKACEKIQGQLTSGACSIAQKAATEALKANLHETIKMREAFRKRKEIMLSYLRNIDGLISNDPQGAFYIFPDIHNFFGKAWREYKINNAEDLCNYLLMEGNIGCVSGDSFGDPNCIRLAYAISEEQVHEAMRRLKVCLEKLS
jgi:aspartate aminotransferase